MSDDGRRVFPMETVLDVISGKTGPDVLDFLGFAVSRPVCDCCRAAVAPVVKGWVYSLNPEFMKTDFDESVPYEMWMNGQKKRLGDSVSIPAMPQKESEGIGALLDSVQAAKTTSEEKIAAAEAAQAEVAALTPFKQKAEEFEKKAAQLEEKNKTLTEQVNGLKKELAGFAGKVAIDAADLEKSVKDMVAKAVKDALANLPVGAAAAGGAASGDTVAASSESSDGTGDSQGEVPDTFGFGSSAPSDDGFGF